MAAPTVVTTYSSVQGDGGGNGAAITTDTAPTTDDYLVVCISDSQSTTPPTAPGGWTELTLPDHAASGPFEVYCYYLKNPADSTTYTWTVSGTRKTIIGALVRGAHGTSPFDESDSLETATGTSHGSPTVATAGADRLLACFCVLRGFPTSAWTENSGGGWTEQVERVGGDGSTNIQMSLQTKTAATSGNYSDTFACANSEPALLALIAIAPAAAGTTHEVSGDRSVSASITGALAADRPLSGDRSVSSTMLGAIALDIGLAGQRSISAAATGALAADRPLAADRAAAVNAVGALSVAAGTSGSLTVTVAATGALSVSGQVELSGALAVSVTPTGGIEVPAAVNLGALVEDILNAVVSHAAALGHFDKVNQHEPKHKPGNGFTAAVWLQAIDPAPTVSGLNSTSARLAWTIRLYQNFIMKPEDMIDVRMLRAASDLIQAYHTDFTLGGKVRNVDLLGEVGIPLSGKAGYLPLDNALYRTIDITVPLIVNDVWVQGG